MGRRENILAQSTLPPFVGGSNPQAFKKILKKIIGEEKNKNVGGKATQDKPKGCVNRLISTDCIQLSKRCWENTEDSV